MKIQNKSRDALLFFKFLKSLQDVSDLAKDVIEYDAILLAFLVRVARGLKKIVHHKSFLQNEN